MLEIPTSYVSSPSTFVYRRIRNILHVFHSTKMMNIRVILQFVKLEEWHAISTISFVKVTINRRVLCAFVGNADIDNYSILMIPSKSKKSLPRPRFRFFFLVVFRKI